MGLMGFGQRWRKWIHACLSSTCIYILINGSPTKDFSLQKGVRQGDPLSPYLFIMVAEGLNHLTKTVAANNRFAEIQIGWGDINFHKSCVYGLGVSKVETEDMAEWLGYVAGTLPIIYLGLPISSSMNKSKAWDPVFEKFEGLRRRFFWSGSSDVSTMAWIKWDSCLRPQDFGGLDIAPLALKDRALIAKWWWRFKHENGSLWVSIIKSIYGEEGGLSASLPCPSNRLSSTWAGILKVGKNIHNLDRAFANSFTKRIVDGSGREEWAWSWGKDGLFTVSRITDILVLADLVNQNSTATTLHNSFVPLKVELFIWRARLKRLPTRVELDKRGMDLGMWNLGPFTNMSINESFMGEGYSFTSAMDKLLWQATEWVTWYMILKSRNATTFSKAKSTSAMVFKEIQIKSFKWLSNKI
ncbi:uncharacterized protein [Rutidosis leptorrhynchoides]|uniref:uncharacterized protein n=1 Tax=Rutidosis leptorrhynchoides TaxID=125765 RepID=UPI003A99B32E